MVHIVTYDLKEPNDTVEDYKRVIDGLKAQYGTWCHLEQSVWLISTTQTASDVRDSVKKLLSPKDVLFVAKLAGNWATFNVSADRTTWLKAREF